jgi:hypothetical protein
LDCAVYPYQFLWTFLAISLHKLWHLWPTHFDTDDTDNIFSETLVSID